MLAQVLAAVTLGTATFVSPSSLRTNTRPPPPTVADPIKGLDLWRGAKVGMSASELKLLFPSAASPADTTTLTGGQVGRLQLGPFDMNGRQTTAHFYFSGQQLVSVELTATGFRPGEPQRNIELAGSIAAKYSATYGQGYDCGDKSLGDIAIYECKWLKGQLSIQLWYMDVAGQAPLFYVAYRQADDPSYNL